MEENRYRLHHCLSFLKEHTALKIEDSQVNDTGSSDSLNSQVLVWILEPVAMSRHWSCAITWVNNKI